MQIGTLRIQFVFLIFQLEDFWTSTRVFEASAWGSLRLQIGDVFEASVWGFLILQFGAF